MHVRIGVTYVARELDVELPNDTDTAALQEQIAAAVADQDTMLWLTDRRGQRIGVPTERLAYVQIGSPDAESRIGFGSQ